MFVKERYSLGKEFSEGLRSRPVPWGFGAFSEAVYYRTYSRVKPDGGQEAWADTVIRVVEGAMSIRKDWYRTSGLKWNRKEWDEKAKEMASLMFDMKFLPPGRGLWAMGTDYIYQRGAMSLYNCGYVDVTDHFSLAVECLMDMLMCGVGVGFSTHRTSFDALSMPDPKMTPKTFAIPDSREGWTDSLRRLIATYEAPGRSPIAFDYSQIRPEGAPLKGFGGIAAGPGPLMELHGRVKGFLDAHVEGRTSKTRLVADVMNSVGACVVAGNVRRSAEIALGSIEDKDFLDLKNYAINPDRKDIGWMSNNSGVMGEGAHFDMLPSIADRIRDNGEPGIVNLINIQKYGRVGKKLPDRAIGINPCGEIPLEDREVCNLVEVFPTRCADVKEFFRALEIATLYASTVSLLPTHRKDTNRVVARNRRIGVSVSGIADWLDATSWSKVTRTLREGYEGHVVPTNRALAEEAGVAPSVRLSTVKPSGTISLLAGVSPGMHWPIHRHYIRRVRVSESSPVAERLVKAGVPNEPDKDSKRTLVFEFPLQSGNGKTRAASEVSVWEQASLAAMLNREWADNAVSNTLTFSPSKEGHQVERVIACFAPLVKSMSLLPDQGEQKSYEQAPYERIDEAEYKRRSKGAKAIDWKGFGGSDGQDSRFCDGDSCALETAQS